MRAETQINEVHKLGSTLGRFNIRFGALTVSHAYTNTSHAYRNNIAPDSMAIRNIQQFSRFKWPSQNITNI